MKLKHKLTSLIALFTAIVMAHPGHHHDLSAQNSNHTIMSIIFVAVILGVGVFAFYYIRKKQKSK